MKPRMFFVRSTSSKVRYLSATTESTSPIIQRGEYLISISSIPGSLGFPVENLYVPSSIYGMFFVRSSASHDSADISLYVTLPSYPSSTFVIMKKPIS